MLTIIGSVLNKRRKIFFANRWGKDQKKMNAAKRGILVIEDEVFTNLILKISAVLFFSTRWANLKQEISKKI